VPSCQGQCGVFGVAPGLGRELHESAERSFHDYSEKESCSGVLTLKANAGLPPAPILYGRTGE
jgi:hypothetical protein